MEIIIILITYEHNMRLIYSIYFIIHFDCIIFYYVHSLIAALSLLLQPFLISPTINTGDIVVAFNRYPELDITEGTYVHVVIINHTCTYFWNWMYIKVFIIGLLMIMSCLLLFLVNAHFILFVCPLQQCIL